MKSDEQKQHQQDWKKTKQRWQGLPKGVRVTFIVIGIILILSILIGMLSPSDKNQNNEIAQTTQESKKEEQKLSPQELMFESVSKLIDAEEAFDTGSYLKGDIPKGEYAFISFEGSGRYYSEEDSAGNIIDNENFDSFGYVYVHDVGNLQTQGVLIKVDALEKLGVKSAKEIYEKLNDTIDYKDSAMYKVGVDIEPGTYAIEAYGQGYVEVMSGPVGNSSIVDNEIFNGKYSISVSTGQYLKVSKGRLL